MPSIHKNVLIACDAFKDALSALDACEAIGDGLIRTNKHLNITLFPMADGGEGTVDILHYHLGGRLRKVDTVDPLGRPIDADYFISHTNVAFIDMAAAAGLQLLKPAERNPLSTSTKGVGILIRDAIYQGVKEIMLGVGGSATNDCGLGMATALGWKCYDEQGGLIEDPVGRDLASVERIEGSDQTDVKECRFTILCDVDNVLFGKTGAAHIYAPQKGASPEQVEALDQGLRHVASIIERDLGARVAHRPGAGAAGGMGAAGLVFFDGVLRPGAQAIMEQTGFAEALERHDVLIVGEGKLDRQTLRGKLIHHLCKCARNLEIPVYAMCGSIEASDIDLGLLGINKAVEISPREWPLDEALRRTGEMLRHHAGLLGL